MNIDKIINEIRNPFTEQLTEAEFDIVCDVHHWSGKLYNNKLITLEWHQHDEFWIRPIYILEDEYECIEIWRKINK